MSADKIAAAEERWKANEYDDPIAGTEIGKDALTLADHCIALMAERTDLDAAVRELVNAVGALQKAEIAHNRQPDTSSMLDEMIARDRICAALDNPALARFKEPQP